MMGPRPAKKRRMNTAGDADVLAQLEQAASPPSALPEPAALSEADKFNIALAAAVGESPLLTSPDEAKVEATPPTHTTPSDRVSTPAARPLWEPLAGMHAKDVEGWAPGDRYRLERMLGRGSYGEVAQATDKHTGKKVAIKRIARVFHNTTDAHRILREIHILRQLHFTNIIQLLDIPMPPSYNTFQDLYLVFEFVDTDLSKLIRSEQYLSVEHIQTFLYQLLCGLSYMHRTNVIHRDIKPANILLNEDCSLRICDFGLSRIMSTVAGPDTPAGGAKAPTRTRSLSVGQRKLMPSPMPTHPRRDRFQSVDAARAATLAAKKNPVNLKRQLTKHVVTRWYRPPELILLQEYTVAVDVWSVGCIFAELLSMQRENVSDFRDRLPLFPGTSCFPLSADSPQSYSEKLDQLNVIFDVIGTPSKEDLASLKGGVKTYLAQLPHKPPADAAARFPGTPPAALDLLRRMLQFNPAKRITVQEALQHEFLRNVRMPSQESVVCEPLSMDAVENSHKAKASLKHKIYQEIILFRRGVGAGARAAKEALSGSKA